MANGMHGYNGNGNGMGGGMANSPAPYIKHEPQDDSARYIPQQSFNHHPDAYSMSAGNSHYQQHGGFHDHHFSNGEGSIDPSELTMSPTIPVQQSGGFMQSYGSPYTGNQGMSYMGGGAAVDDDDLLALGNLDDRPNDQHHHDHNPNGGNQDFSSLQHLFPEMGQDQNREHGGNGIPVGSNPEHVFSHTPENAPAESPFIRGFPPQYQQLRSYNGATAETPSSYNASPIIGSDHSQGTNFDQYMSTGKRKVRPGMERSNSRKSPQDAMSPHTPKTPALGGLSLGTPESSSLPAQPIQTLGGHRHHKSLSSQWDGTPGSAVSFMDSPLSSPGQGPVHSQISEVFKSGKHASLPAKVENAMGGGSGPAFQTQEAKRRRRRESHNMVERRRRDNINERIQELSHLVPQHRLEDEKVRKHLINNGSLSPTVGTSGSPPRATSMLAGGVGRRASGVATTGISSEDKDKGPNKGDILNGAVGWTRDLMWALHQKLQQEKEVRELVERLGGTYPFESSEEEKRMASELSSAMERNGPQNFRYSRAPGSSLRVPGYTDYAGQPVSSESAVMSPRVSPSSTGNPNGSSSRGTPQQQQQSFWNQEGQAPITFKEEEEYGDMDMS